jgi:hypothetical protein
MCGIWPKLTPARCTATTRTIRRIKIIPNTFTQRGTGGGDPGSGLLGVCDIVISPSVISSVSMLMQLTFVYKLNNKGERAVHFSTGSAQSIFSVRSSASLYSAY